MYHGTAKQFDEFKSQQSNGWSVPRDGFYFAEEKHVAEEFGDAMNVYLSAKNPADLRFDDDAFWKIYEGLPENQQAKIDALQYYDKKYGAVVSGLTQTPEFLQAARAAGYDSMIFGDQLGGSVSFDSYVMFSSNQIKSATDNNGEFNPEENSILLSRAPEQQTPRTSAFPADAALLADFRNDEPLKRHADYRAAKSGDADAAAELVKQLVKSDTLEAARQRFGSDVAYLPVMAQEASGKNAIPNALASYYANATGTAKAGRIFQVNKAYHTGADAMQRMIARSEFAGEVIPGQKYVLVDDVSTMGGTLADLASYIQSKGGVVSGAVLLTNASRSGIIQPDAKIIRRLEADHGQAIREILGIEPDSLTRDEAQYLLGFRSSDELRNRAAKASDERAARIAAKALPERADAVTPPAGEALLSRAPDQSSLPLQGGATASRASWSAPEKSKLDWFIYQIQDKYVDLKRVTQAIREAGKSIKDSVDTYLQEELYHGRTAYRTEQFLEKEMTPLVDMMRLKKIEMADFEEYLWMRHAEERNIQIAKVNPDMPNGGSGIDTEEARDYLENLPAQKKADYELLAKRVDAMTSGTRKLLVDERLEAPDTIKAMQEAYQHYVPLMRDGFEDHVMGTGQGFSVKGNSSKRATGSNRAVVDILANIALQRERAIVRAEKNRVAKSLIGLAALNPNPEFWRVNKPPMIRIVNEKTGLVEDRIDPNYKSRDNVVMARDVRDGKVVEYSLVFNEHDERAMRMSQAIKNLDRDSMGEIIGRVGTITRYFASINTQYNPIFGIKNIIRDMGAAALNLSTTPLAGKERAVIADIPRALMGIYSDIRNHRKGKGATSPWAALFEEMQEVGGQTGYRDQYRNAKERGEAIQHALDPDWWLTTKAGKVLTAGGFLEVPERVLADKAVRPMFDWLSDYNEAMENATRLAAYKHARDSGMSKERAASLAKNITTNFNRKGRVGREMGALYAFFNASVQGTARILETLKGKRGKQIIAGGVIFGVLQAVALAMAGMDDEDPPDFVKDRNLIIPAGDGTYLSIPLPLGFNVIPAFGRRSVEAILYGHPMDKAVDMLALMMDAANPLGSSTTLQTIAPTVLDPMAALAENKNWNNRPIYKEDRNGLDPKPGFTRSRDNATAISKMIAEAINTVTGGNSERPGFLSPTADQLDYLGEQVGGGVWRDIISKPMMAIESAMTGEELAPYKRPVIGSFYGDTKSTASQGSRYYENIKELNILGRELEAIAANDGDTDSFIKDHPEVMYSRMADKIDGDIAKLRKYRRQSVEAGASKDDLHQIDESITSMMRTLNDEVKASQRAQRVGGQ